MKIWFQAVAMLGIDPVFSEHEANLKNHLNRIARPGTEVAVQGVATSSPNIDIYQTEAVLHNRQVVENLLRAQEEGYDAFCVGCMLDPAFYAIREIADIPVCSLAESSMLMACLLAPNFSLLCHNKAVLRRIIELVKRYGLKDRFIECDCFQISLTEVQKGFQDPEVLLEPARKVAREAAGKGVCQLINCCGCLNSVFAKHDIHEIEGIPVLDGSAAIIKMAEMLVDLKQIGIDRSRLGLYTPIPKGDLGSLLDLYGVRHRRVTRN